MPQPAPRPSALRLALLLGGLGMLGPFAIDTVFPAFPLIGGELRTDDRGLQAIIAAYLVAFGIASLFHGPLSDALGRRSVILVSTLLFVLASIGAALAPTLTSLLLFRALQGVAAGAGTIVGRAVIRDVLDGPQAQHLMSLVTMVFALGPILAPIIGGVVLDFGHWRLIFGLIAGFGALTLLGCLWALPETLPAASRRPLHLPSLASDCVSIVRDRPGLLLIVAAAANFSAFFVWIASAPVLVFEYFGLDQHGFWRLFVPAISGIVIGSRMAAWLATRERDELQLGVAYAVMCMALLLQAIGIGFHEGIDRTWAPLCLGLYGVGSATAFPLLTVRLLDRFPDTRGAASSMQTCIALLLNGAVAMLLVPWASAWPPRMVVASGLLCGLGALCALLWMAGGGNRAPSAAPAVAGG